jgi:hypothetical protein
VSKNKIKHQRSCSKCLPPFAMRKLQHDVPKKTELGSECLWFGEFPERRFELAGSSTCTPFRRAKSLSLPGSSVGLVIVYNISWRNLLNRASKILKIFLNHFFVDGRSASFHILGISVRQIGIYLLKIFTPVVPRCIINKLWCSDSFSI